MDEILDVNCKFFGRFNIYNLLAALVVAKKAGVTNSWIMKVLPDINAPDGRFNVIRKDGITYVVDFAHTPDGMFNLLREGRRMTENKVITVFGCGGDRDVTKRRFLCLR